MGSLHKSWKADRRDEHYSLPHSPQANDVPEQQAPRSLDARNYDQDNRRSLWKAVSLDKRFIIVKLSTLPLFLFRSFLKKLGPQRGLATKTACRAGYRLPKRRMG